MAILAISVGGCLEHVAAPPLVDAGTNQAMAIQLIDCNDAILAFRLDRAEIQASLPSGYKAIGLVPGTADVNLEVKSCARVTLDNQTVLSDVGFASALAFVQAPANVDAASEVDLFILEAFTTSADLAKALRLQGFPLEVGSMTLETGMVHEDLFTIDVPGRLHYDAVGLLMEGDSAVSSDQSTRKTHFLDEGNEAWFWDNTTERIVTSIERVYGMQVEGGFFGSIATSNAGVLATVGSSERTSTTLTFGSTKELA